MSKQYNIKKVILFQVYVALGLLILLAVGVFWSAFKLQVYEKDKWVAMSAKQSLREAKVPAIRGNILAADGRILATSISKYELRWDLSVDMVRDSLPKKLDSLATLFNIHFADTDYAKSKSQWKNKIKSWYSSKMKYQLLAKDVDYELVKEMKTWPIFRVNNKYKSGLLSFEKTKRVRPFEGLARRTIGDLRGANRLGVEEHFDSLLKGQNGRRIEQKLHSGRWMPIDDEDEIIQKNGYDIVTTLDVEMQDIAEQALRRTMIQNEAKTGTVVLMEVATGAIKAIANLTKNSDGRYVDVNDYSINDATDPGSTFKLVSYMALLEDGFVKPTDSVDIHWGKAQFYDRTMVDAGTPPRTKYTVQECFERSSNVGIATLIQKYYGKNPEKFIARIKQTLIEQPTGIEIRGEKRPRIKTPEDKGWSGVSLPWMAIGYENQITPLGMLAVYNAIANNGAYMKPYLVSEVKEKGNSIHKFEPVVKKEQICSEATLIMLKQMLEGVVNNGTATNLKSLSFTVAGKTGTAQVIKNNRYDKNAHKASFVGYFPADKPRYSCIVVISEPRMGVYYGSLVAGPVFGEIADKVYAHSLDIHPLVNTGKKTVLPAVKNGDINDIKQVLNKLGISSDSIQVGGAAQMAKSTSKGKYVSLTAVNYSLNLVPNVIGMGLRDAMFLLEERKLKVVVEGYGKVRGQSILGGARIVKGSTIKISLRP